LHHVVDVRHVLLNILFDQLFILFYFFG
jgi:hypothetical protein